MLAVRPRGQTPGRGVRPPNFSGRPACIEFSGAEGGQGHGRPGGSGGRARRRVVRGLRYLGKIALQDLERFPGVSELAGSL